MAQEKNKQLAAIPTVAVFRRWLVAALAAIEVTPAGLARELDLGRNTINQFLRDELRGIDMTNAGKIQNWIIDHAAENDVELPFLRAQHE
ncbi:MAG: hypothetical protein KUG74_07360 [Rhodobacteraceae bacterium]|nr:hypothetical protein [Paracoccaceae bacterium]